MFYLVRIGQCYLGSWGQILIPPDGSGKLVKLLRGHIAQLLVTGQVCLFCHIFNILLGIVMLGVGIFVHCLSNSAVLILFPF